MESVKEINLANFCSSYTWQKFWCDLTTKIKCLAHKFIDRHSRILIGHTTTKVTWLSLFTHYSCCFGSITTININIAANSSQMYILTVFITVTVNINFNIRNKNLLWVRVCGPVKYFHSIFYIITILYWPGTGGGGGGGTPVEINARYMCTKKYKFRMCFDDTNLYNNYIGSIYIAIVLSLPGGGGGGGYVYSVSN